MNELSKDLTVTVRAEAPGDLEAIREVNVAAFGQDLEARIVEALRDNDGVSLSLIALCDAEIVGHILFSPASIELPGGRCVAGAGLGPMAVLPERQRQGIGTRLIEDGLARLRRAGCPFVAVLGHPDYYPRFGFEPASRRSIRCEWNVPDAAFMIRVLDAAVMHDVAGTVRYRREFSDVE